MLEMEAVDRDGDQRAAKRRRRTPDADEVSMVRVHDGESWTNTTETHAVFVADPGVVAYRVRSGAVPSTTSTAAHGDKGWFCAKKKLVSKEHVMAQLARAQARPRHVRTATSRRCIRARSITQIVTRREGYDRI